MATTETTAENRARVGAHRQLSTPTAIVRRKRRTIHRNTWSLRLRRRMGEVRLERFGLDIAGNSLAVSEDRRRLRNARKVERVNVDQLIASARANTVARAAAAARMREIMKGRKK